MEWAVKPDDLNAYAPYRAPGARLITWTTMGRDAVLAQAGVASLLLAVLEESCRREGFTLLAHAILPEHAHLLLAPGAGSVQDRMMARSVALFERGFQELMGMPGPASVWQSGYRMQRVDDLVRFAACLDFIHYNPVHHGLSARPEEWAYSSYATWVERRVYTLGWGWRRPYRLADQDWE